MSIHLLFFIYSKFICLLSKPKDFEESKVCFIKIDALGDFILWFNCAQSLSEGFADKSKVLICSKQLEELVRSLNLFDIIIAVDPKKYVRNHFYRLSLYFHLSSYHIDDLIQCNYSRSFWLHDDLAFSIKSKRKIAPEGDLLNSRRFFHDLGLKFYSDIIPNQTTAINQIEKNYVFIECLGLKISRLKPSIPDQCIDHSLELNTPYFVVFMGASVSFRRWPVSKFVELSKYISLKTGWVPVLCGIHNEANLGEMFEQNYKGNLFNLIGKTSLTQFFGIASSAHLLIGNDTSSVHIASAVDTPSIALVGGGHYGHFLPYPSSLIGNCHPTVVDFKMDCFNCNWKCPYVKSSEEIVPCVSSIKVNDAKTAFDDIYSSLK